MNPGDAVTRKLVTFGRILREAGMEVGPGRLQMQINGEFHENLDVKKTEAILDDLRKRS